MADSTKLPYVSSPKLMTNILIKIKEATAPDRFTQDFLETKLGFKGGNYRQFISLGKKLGLLNSDGSPTDLYKSFRNPSNSKVAIAKAIRIGYRELFERNEYAGNLDKEKIKGLVVEITGSEPKEKKVQLICQTFEVLRAQADFDKSFADTNGQSGDKAEGESGDREDEFGMDEESKIKIGLGYTINLVLPKTDDPAVFNAIFKSLRENLLRR